MKGYDKKEFQVFDQLIDIGRYDTGKILFKSVKKARKYSDWSSDFSPCLL
jgi:hypothetical protein